MSNQNLIGKHFIIEYPSKAREESIVQGNNYRFTILDDAVIRMEYSDNGQFENRATQLIVNRALDTPNFVVTETDEIMEISTKNLLLTYHKNQPFSQATLSIVNKTDSVVGKGVWRYGFKEERNIKGTARTLDRVDGAIDLEDGIFSEEGYVILDDSNSMAIENGFISQRNNENIDLYYLGFGNDYKHGLEVFYQLTGNTPLIPRFALGNWWSRYWPYTDEELKHQINQFNRLDIPLSVAIIDMDWHITDIPKEYGSGWTGYTWNKELFPNPKETLKWFHKNDLKVGLNLHPALGIRPHEDAYEKVATRLDLNPKDKKLIPFDITNPNFVKSYFEDVHYPLEKDGVDFWWMDWQQGKNTDIKGLDPLWLLNHLHYLDRTKNKLRGFTFSRYAGLGSHRYPIGFSGDTVSSWESLAFQPYFTSHASLIGYGWWSHDIGGHYRGKYDRELYTRWVQYGVFSPIFRLHSTNNFYLKRAPFEYDESVRKITSEMMRLRHKLVPYIYTMAYYNSLGNLPLIRPMEVEEYNKNKYKDQYYFGDSLIASPIITKSSKILNMAKKVTWLPKGLWYDFFTGEEYKGNLSYTTYSNLAEVPVFAKSGSIIPLANDYEKINNPNVLDLIVFPSNEGSFDMYEDDGETQKYKNGQYAITSFKIIHEEGKKYLIIDKPVGDSSVIPNNREYRIFINGINSDIFTTLKGLKMHKIELAEIKNIYKPYVELTKKLETVRIENAVKRKIGYVQYEPFVHKGGLISFEMPLHQKIHKLNQMDIHQEVKDMIIDYLTKHQKSS
jgi:alpha-glucosidase (family GH31 glycosyl hydrolase)